MKPIHIGSIPLNTLTPEPRTELRVIAIGDKFFRLRDIEVDLCDSPRDAYNWNNHDLAMDCAIWLKHNMFPSTRVFVQRFIILGNRLEEIK